MRRFHLDFRAKLLSIIAVAAIPFVGLVIAGAVLGARVERQLTLIQELYVPKLELQPKLEGELDRIARAFQDAVAAGDVDQVAAGAQAKGRLLDDLDAARSALSPSVDAELRAAVEDYFGAAYGVTRRLIAGETGEPIVEAASAMQAKQARVTYLVGRAAALDRREVGAAFAKAARIERTTREYQIAIGAIGLALALALSLALSRSVLRVVAALEQGLSRFGTGDFGAPIPVASQDELGRVAAHANRMAQSLDQLGREQRRTAADLAISNKELEAFSYSVAHDLRAPLRGINGFSHALEEDYGHLLDAEGREYLHRIAAAAGRMGELIDALLALARVSRAELRREPVDLTKLGDAVAKQLRAAYPDRALEFVNQPGVLVEGDPVLLRAVLENLLGNAWKFTGKNADARVDLCAESEGPATVYCVRDNGAGFDMAYAAKLFAPFQRLHAASDFAGTGVGLATVDRIIRRHGGRIWAEGAVGRGAIFRFTIPTQKEGVSS